MSVSASPNTKIENIKVLVSCGRRFLFKEREVYLTQEEKQSLGLSDGVILNRPAVNIQEHSKQPGHIKKIEFIQLKEQFEVEEPFGFHDVRKLIFSLPPDEQKEMLRIVHLGHWLKRHMFCGMCGGETEDSEIEIARICTSCGEIFYPRISPSAIGAVIRDGKILMGRSPHFPEGMVSVLAGFVEPGENAEEAFAREVMEESSIAIESIEYVASQPWPFPDSLMIGFFAKYKSGEIKIDTNELEFADWYSVEDLKDMIIPKEYSIARVLIDKFIKEYSL